ncbi:MAG: HD domain-containing protein, partial [Candidatus Hydrothermarchaeaceae archaeon]
MKNTKVIRDSIHGDVFLSDLEFDIIDTPEFQRLRRIKQLGMTHLVYPSANHTRFEHSIGSLHLAGRIADRLDIDVRERENVRIAALLHDVGHGPLSHTSEEFLARYLKQPHEGISREIIENSSISRVLEDAGHDPPEISDILGEQGGYLRKIISSGVDVDRMDYLVRDAHHTGVAYGIIDLDRIINTIQVHNDTLVVTERGLKAVEALLVARFLMIPTVYLHRTSRIADVMFLKATEVAISEGLDYRAFHRMDDFEVANLFRESQGYVKEISERFDNRRLFKIAHYCGWNEIDDGLRDRIIALRKDITRLKDIEREIAADSDASDGYVLLDIPEVPDYMEMDARILKNGEVIGIEEASPLVGIMRDAQKAQWNIGVYTPKEHLERV